MTIEAIKMPKWGLAMEEGKIVEWWVKEGDSIKEGDDLVDIETSKITNVCEAHIDGKLRKIVAAPDETIPVGALIGVFASDDVPDEDIESFITDYQDRFGAGETDEGAAGPDIRSVEVYGRTLRVGVMGEGGQGVPIVLLHGFGGDLNNWMLVQPALAESRPCYAIELPGHGQSSKDVGDGKLRTIASGIIAAINALGLDTFALIGHSFGGAIGVEVAARLRERVTGLGLICPAAMPGGDLNSDYLDAFVSARRARDLREPVRLLFSNEDFVTRDILEDLIRAKRIDGAPEALTLLKDNLKGGDPDYLGMSAKLELVVAPITLIVGAADKIVGTSAIDRAVKSLVLEGVGHMPHLERSTEIVDALQLL